VVSTGNPAAILPQTVKDFNVDLIIVGTHGRAGWKKLVLGSVAESVIDQAPCPVLTVGPSTNRTRIQESGPSEILLAGAGSNRSQLASSYALSLARKYRSRLSVVDVLEDRAGRVLAEVSQFEWDQVAEPSDRPRTTALRSPAESGTRSDLILSVANQTTADLIVLAVPANHRFTDRFLSSNSYRIVCGAACPVLTVHAGADRGPGE
jgi:nucleotide-binding universal stress UspA family protein